MICYKRSIQYYETDKMGITHHANYLHFMEEARLFYLESIGLPFADLEAMGLASPVLQLSVDYRCPSTFGDTLEISVRLSSYHGARLCVQYEMRDAETGKLVCTAASQHCFLKDGVIYAPRRENPQLHAVLQRALAQDTAQREAAEVPGA